MASVDQERNHDTYPFNNDRIDAAIEYINSDSTLQETVADYPFPDSELSETLTMLNIVGFVEPVGLLDYNLEVPEDQIYSALEGLEEIANEDVIDFLDLVDEDHGYGYIEGEIPEAGDIWDAVVGRLVEEDKDRNTIAGLILTQTGSKYLEEFRQEVEDDQSQQGFTEDQGGSNRGQQTSNSVSSRKLESDTTADEELRELGRKLEEKKEEGR